VPRGQKIGYWKNLECVRKDFNILDRRGDRPVRCVDPVEVDRVMPDTH